MLSRRHLLLAAGAGLSLAGCATAKPAPAPAAPPPPAPPPAPPPSPEQQLSALLEKFFVENLEVEPELATSLGLDVGARAGMKSRLHDGSLEALARDKHRTADQLARLSAIDRKALSGMPAVNYDAVYYDLKATDADNRRFSFGGQGAGQPYVLSQITGSYQEAPDFLATQHTIETKADCDAYVARLNALGRLLDDETERSRHDVGQGVTPPDFALKGAIGSMQSMLVAPETSVFVTALVNRAKAKGIAGDWEAAAVAAYRDQVAPALQRQQEWLKSALPKAVHDAGVWRLPDGEAYYAAALAAWTTTTMTPQEVHQMGLDELRELHGRMDPILRSIRYTEGSVGARMTALGSDPRYQFADGDAGRTEIMAFIQDRLADIRTRLPRAFNHPVRGYLEVVRISPCQPARP